MKTIRQTIMWLALALGLASCSGVFYDVKPDALRSVQKGMSKQEVTNLLGEPQFRRFDRDLDEWEFSKYVAGSGNTTIIVSFEDDKVVAMDSFATPYHPAPSVTVAPSEVVVAPPVTVYVKGMRESEFQRFYERVKSRTFKDDMLEEIAVGADRYSLNCNQCARLMSLFPFDDEKMKVLRLYAPHIADRENYKDILDELSSLFKQDDAKKLLKVDKNRF